MKQNPKTILATLTNGAGCDFDKSSFYTIQGAKHWAKGRGGRYTLSISSLANQYSEVSEYVYAGLCNRGRIVDAAMHARNKAAQTESERLAWNAAARRLTTHPY
tara:strand:- start:11555 stop:11866 length:312 start_codon:yes stop_codon:yes gene_type:complete